MKNQSGKNPIRGVVYLQDRVSVCRVPLAQSLNIRIFVRKMHPQASSIMPAHSHFANVGQKGCGTEETRGSGSEKEWQFRQRCHRWWYLQMCGAREVCSTLNLRDLTVLGNSDCRDCTGSQIFVRVCEYAIDPCSTVIAYAYPSAGDFIASLGLTTMLSNKPVAAEVTYSPTIRRGLTLDSSQKEGDARTGNNSPTSNPIFHSRIHSRGAMQMSSVLLFSMEGELGFPRGYQAQGWNCRGI